MADPLIIAAGVAFGWAGIVAAWTVHKRRKQRAERMRDADAAGAYFEQRVHRDPPRARPATAHRARIKPAPASYDAPTSAFTWRDGAEPDGIEPGLDWANNVADSPSYSGGGGEFGGGGASGGWDSGGGDSGGSGGGGDSGGGGSSD